MKTQSDLVWRRLSEKTERNRIKGVIGGGIGDAVLPGRKVTYHRKAPWSRSRKKRGYYQGGGYEEAGKRRDGGPHPSRTKKIEEESRNFRREAQERGDQGVRKGLLNWGRE